MHMSLQMAQTYISKHLYRVDLVHMQCNTCPFQNNILLIGLEIADNCMTVYGIKKIKSVNFVWSQIVQVFYPNIKKI